MGYQTWHNYGYGICVSDINTESVERLKRLLHCAPKYEAKINAWLKECGIDHPAYEDYMEFDQDYHLGLATILCAVMQENERITFFACDDYEGACYVLYAPSYPWELPEDEAGLTKERMETIFCKYVSILTNQEIKIDYQSVENGG